MTEPITTEDLGDFLEELGKFLRRIDPEWCDMMEKEIARYHEKMREEQSDE